MEAFKRTYQLNHGPLFNERIEAGREFINIINLYALAIKGGAHLARLRIVTSNIFTFCNNGTADMDHIFFKYLQFEK